eukprot:6201102-Amphidinium_carterae.1
MQACWQGSSGKRKSGLRSSHALCPFYPDALTLLGLGAITVARHVSQQASFHVMFCRLMDLGRWKGAVHCGQP